MNSTARSKPNTHLSTPGTNAAFSPVHIFTPNPSTELTQQLTNANISHVLHNRPKELDTLLSSRPPGSKLVVLVETGPDHHNTTQGGFLFPPHYKFPRSLENTYFSFYSLTLSSTREVLQGAKLAVDYCLRCLGKDHKRIQLRSVHSLSTSRDKTLRSHRSPQPTRYTDKPQYIELHYFQDLSSQIRSSTNYRLFVGSLDGMERAIPFETFEQLTIKLKNRDKRCLVLTNNTQLSLLLEMLKKESITNFDLMILGLLEANTLYLSPHIVLATNDSTMVSKFIEEQGFRFPPPPEDMKRSQRFSISSTDFKNIMSKIMKEDSEHSSTNNVFRSTFRSGTRFDTKPVRHWKIDKDPRDSSSFVTTEVLESNVNFAEFSEKKRPKKFKSPGRSIFSVESEQSHQPLLQSVYKRPSESGQSPKNITTFQNEDTNNRNENCRQNPSIQPIFTYDNNYRNPISNIIPEVSDQYRGSNKESIMNIEASMNSKNFKQQASGSQFASNHRLEEQLLRTGNQSLKYTNSQNSIGSTQRLPTDRKIGSQTSLQHITENKGPEIVTDRVSTHKSPVRVVKKAEVITPEEVRPSEQQLPEPAQKTPKVINRYTKNDHYFPPRYAESRASIAARTATNPHVSPTDVTKHHKEEKSPSQKVVHPAFQNSFNRQFEGFERVEKDGVVLYRRKVTNQPDNSNQTKVVTSNKSSPSFSPRTITTYTEARHTPQKPIPKEVAEETHKKTSTTEQSRNISKYYANSPQSNTASVLPFKSTVKPSVVQKPSGKGPAFMNDSMFSRMSELHSDGSILRRNNMRFGVKAKKKEQPEPSMLWQESRIGNKLKSGIYKPEGNSRKNALNRVLVGQEALEQERNELHHVNTQFNNFHFLIHEELTYLNVLLGNHLKGSTDRFETFGSLQHMFECIRPEKTGDFFDGGFIFTLKHHIPLINPKILPQDYYIVVVDRFKGPLLEVNEESRRVRLDHLGHLSLVEKIIVDAKLYQYVAYSSHRKEIQTLADKFLQTQFVLEKIETQFSSEIIDFYYCQLPRLTRLYILCGKQELPELLRLMTIYQQFNPAFDPQSVKLICLIGNILQNDDLIMDHPSVTFINNPEDIKHYTDILRYAHYTEDPKRPFLLDHFFYHHKHGHLETKLDTAFPGRFQLCPFNKLSEIYPKIDRINKVNSNRQLSKLRHYMLLPDNLNGQKLSTQHFYKIYMLGKGKSVQSSIVRVLNLDELVELLKV